MFSVPARLNIRAWASMSVRMWFPQRQFYTQRIPQFDPPPDAPTVNLKINNRNVSVPAGTTILKACKKSHIFIPTLCYHPMLSIVGQCRVCLVELGNGKLVPSCATEVSEGMIVKTNSPEVVDSIKHNLQFLRCRHPNACMTCEANGHCEFQSLVTRYEVEELLPERLHHDRSHLLDLSSNALIRDMNKCVNCSRCVRACSEIQGMNIYGITRRGEDITVSTVNDLPLAQTACISCGQCTAVCPVGALLERPSVHHVQHRLTNEKDKKIFIAQTAPAVRVAISEEFNMAPGSVSTGKLVSALRTLGFDYVFDTNFAADLTIMEEATEFVKRFTQGDRNRLPMFTSCCPGWINLIEKTYPEMLPRLSSCKSPQGMLSTLIKTYFAEKLGVSADRIVIVSIMPCVAKKDEIKRPQLSMKVTDEKGETQTVADTDYVLTTRELGRLIERERIPFSTLPDSEYDTPLGISTGAAALFGATGGVMEAALRTAHFMITGTDLAQIEMEAVRSLASGYHSIREATVDINGIKVNVAVVTGTINIRRVVEQVKAGTCKYDLVEVMACPGGCIGGGGEPKTMSIDPDVLKKRILAIHGVDRKSTYRMSHHNPAIKRLYEEYLGSPNSELSRKLLHTNYTDRSGEVKAHNELSGIGLEHAQPHPEKK